jgi:hypothetical protein
MDLYARVAFHDNLAEPLVGLTITSSQGVAVYSTHSGWLGAKARPVGPGDVRLFRFSFEPRLYQGDWFVELAVAANQVDMCDVRSKMIHLSVSATPGFSGFIRLDTTFRDLSETAIDQAA